MPLKHVCMASLWSEMLTKVCHCRLSCALDHQTIPQPHHTFRHPPLGDFIPCFQSLFFPPQNMAAVMQPFIKVSGLGVEEFQSMRELWICQSVPGLIHFLMKLQDQHKPHCRPKHVFPQCFGLCL